MKNDEVRVWQHLKYGQITSKVKDTIGGLTCEEAYYDCNGEMIGYWAYGSFDPAYPYQGDGVEVAETF